MKKVDFVFACLMVLGGVGHGFGSYQSYRYDPMILLWAVSASFAEFLLAGLNFLRIGRPRDRALALVSLAGCLVWVLFVLRFGVLLGNLFDFRVVINLVVTLGLAVFSLRSARARAGLKGEA